MTAREVDRTRDLPTGTLVSPVASPDPYQVWTNRTLAVLAGVFAVLWLAGDGTYFTKAITESHNIILAAANVHDPLTLLVQDVAAAPDPGAHPYWYIHHPNLFAKILSLALGGIGLGLSGQVAALLALNLAGLVVAAAAFRRFSSAAALGAIVVAATSYGTFHFSAGDLCRAPLYLLLWPILYALVANPTLTDRRLNLILAASSALSILSDWGLGVFVVAFAFCYGALGRDRVPWRWFLLTVLLPAAAAFLVYELAVIRAVGLDFFLTDVKVTYLGRLGVGDFLDYERLISHFHDHHVIIWPAQGRGTDTILELIASMAAMPLLNTGPAWILLLPVTIAATVSTLAHLRLGARAWSLMAALIALNIVGLLPLPVLALVLAFISVRLVRAPMHTPVRRLCGLVTAVVLGLLSVGVVFPAFTMGFTIAGGRPPLPLLEMSAAALLVELVASGLLVRALPLPARGAAPWPFVSGRLATAWVIVAVLTATLYVVALSKGPFFGIPKHLAIALALVLAGGFVIAIGELRAPSTSGPATGWDRLAQWRIPIFLLMATAALAAHTSATPTILARYSSSYALLLAAIAALTLFSIAAALTPALSARLSAMLSDLISGLWKGPAARQSPQWRAVATVIAVLAIGQVAWFALSALSHPPQPIPYARALEAPQFRGKSFLTTSYEAIAWSATGGWAYMTPANPPPPGRISTRFRHFADWQNEAKYAHPDFYLCDNTRFAYVRPGTSVENAPLQKMSCRACTCRDVAAALAARGHEIVVDGDDYAIVKFNWPERK